MCDLENAIPFEELEQRRKKASKMRELAQTPAHQNVPSESEALNTIQEIFNPSLKLPVSTGPYTMPEAVTADDVDALQDLDIRKLAELKEVFALFDTDCDGLISKEDLRFTYTALGGDVTEELLENMLKEAKDPLDYDAFVELMSFHTIELDPEDVLLEAWSKWDAYGTGKIDEKNCSEHIELFPYLREPVIENMTSAEYVICNRTMGAAVDNSTASFQDAAIFNKDKFIYSSGKIFGIRVRFSKLRHLADDTLKPDKALPIPLNITGEYRFFKKENFKNDGRLIAGSYCDYYFFANPEAITPKKNVDICKYFHSPRFPANYPAHIKCAYKFIGRPESRVEIVFEELQLPKQDEQCSMDKISIFDSESANTHEIDVICDTLPTRRIISSGPDLLIEFNASSNVTAKGFRGRFKFIQNEIGETLPTPRPNASDEHTLPAKETVPVMEKLAAPKLNMISGKEEWSKFVKFNENCKQVFDSRFNKSGPFQLQVSNFLVNLNTLSAIQCRYEFYALQGERVQIKFHDFYMPTDGKNTTECKSSDSLQLLTLVRGKYEPTDLFCGAFIPKPIMSEGKQLFLQFAGRYPPPNLKGHYYGFKAEYKFLSNFGVTTGHQLNDNCSFSYNSSERKSGWFASPNFPGLYPQNIVCNYYFYGESNEKVIVHFTFFDVEGVGTCEHLTASDYVEFSNFMTVDRKFRKHCGKLDKFQVRSDSRFFRISFYSNDRFDKTGFRALYDFESEQIPSENTSMQSYVASTACTSPKSYLYLFLIYQFCTL